MVYIERARLGDSIRHWQIPHHNKDIISYKNIVRKDTLLVTHAHGTGLTRETERPSGLRGRIPVMSCTSLWAGNFLVRERPPPSPNRACQKPTIIEIVQNMHSN